VALGWLWGAYQLAINKLWGGLGVALMSLWVALPGLSMLDVRCLDAHSMGPHSKYLQKVIHSLESRRQAFLATQRQRTATWSSPLLLSQPLLSAALLSQHPQVFTIALSKYEDAS
jgi:hypothetical protein